MKLSKRAVLNCLLLLLCLSSQALSQDPADPDATTDDMDYEDMNDLFTTPPPPPPVLESGSGSGSGLVETIEPTDPPPTSPPDLLPGCTLPEADSVTPRGLDSLSFATIRGRCHSACLRRQEFATSVIETFSGYPFWTLGYSSFLYSEDGRNGVDCLSRDQCDSTSSCSPVNQFLSCKFGCEANLASGATGSSCSKRCMNNCKREVCIEDHGFIGCATNRLPCNAICGEEFAASTGNCEKGCGTGENDVESSDFGMTSQITTDNRALHPLNPPIVTPLGNTLFRVNVVDTMPEFMALSFLPFESIQSAVGFVTVVIRVTGQNQQRFYVLEDSNEVNFGDFFACQTVNISFAIATNRHGQLSNFSPEVTVKIFNIDTSGPDQIVDANVHIEPDTRVRFFRQHIYTITWDQPRNIDQATNISLSLTSGRPTVCGDLGPVVLNANTTRYVVQAPQPTRSRSVAFPPVTECSYSLEIAVNPVDPFGDSMPFQEVVHTGPYPHPANSDWIMRCTAVPQGDIYNITISFELNANFTPVVIEGIEEISIRRDLATLQMRRLITDGSSAVLEPIDAIFNQTSTSNTVSPLRNNLYLYSGTLRYNSSIPNFMRLSSTQVAQAECFVRAPFLPIRIDTARVSIDSFTVDALTNTRFEVTADYSFQYDQPQDTELLRNFELWFTTQRAPDNTTLLTRTLEIIPVLQRNGTIKQTIDLEEDIGNNTDVEVFFQLRARSENLVSSWTNPVTFNVSIETSRPGDISDEQFNVTSFTYGTSINDMGELVARVKVEVNYRLTTETGVLRLEFCTSEQPLPIVKQFDIECSPDSQFDDVVDMVRIGTVVPQKFTSLVVLPSLDTNIYIQVRAVNRASLSGNWSVPEVLHIPDVPSPLNIIATQVGVVQELSMMESNQSSENLPMMDEEVVTFRIRIGMTWEVPESLAARSRRQAVQSSNMPISGYTIVVGMEEITEPFGTLPEDSFQQDVSQSSITQIDVSPEFAVDISNATDNITLYVQMRSSTTEGAFGSWSEPFSLSIDLTPSTTLLTMPTLPTVETGDNMALVLGLSIPFAIIAAIILALIVFLVIYIAYRQFKLRRSLKSDGVEGKAFNLWTDNYPDMPYIPPGMIEGKEVVVDEWEVPTTDVIVEDHLGEGAFGLVFKGIIRGPLRNPKLSSKMKKAIGLPVAIKLLKDTASNKERKDFWMEIDMMKRISEGYCNNIVNMVGCVTLQEPLCLITEFVPHGDLLDYLRNQRKKQSSRRREEKYLRVQLEQQKRAYEEMKKQMEKLQSAQSDAPGEGRIVAGNSGYADFPETSPKPASPNRDPSSTDEKPQLDESSSSDDSPTADKPLIRPTGGETQVAYADFSGVVSPFTIESSLEDSEGVATHKEPRKQSHDPAPYLEPKDEYSHLDPVVSPPPPPQEESDEEMEDELGDIDANDLMQFAYQIATGMEYLASINIVHRDLACRNILVGEGKNLKITDFGLSREVEDVYVKTTKGRLPLKWMALESIDAREFTTFSDVWSYGVVLWEIGTLGGFPYPTIENKDLLTMLKQGYRLEKPDNCAPEVYDIMLECWMEHPQDRPTFSQLRNKFSSLLLATTNDPYMVLEVDEEKTYYTMGAEEEEQFNKDRRESVSSVDSETGIKKEKKKVVEKPKWATQNSNPYVQTPSTFKENHTVVEDEHYRAAVVEVEKEESPARNVLDSSDDDDNATSGSFIPKSNGHPSLSESTSTPAASHLPMLSESATNGYSHLLSPETPVLLEEQVGIPLSFIAGEKPSSQRARPVKRNVSNPYVDDPRTKQLLQEGAEEGKVGSLMQELNQHMAGHDNVTAL